MSQYIVKEGLAHFPALQESGVINFFSFDNTRWGDMSIYGALDNSKFDQAFEVFGVTKPKYLVLAAEHNDNVRVIDRDNLAIYESIYSSKPLSLACDGFITKLPLAMLLTPGDCAAIVITGIDMTDNQRFVLFLHAGFTGTILQIVTKALRSAHSIYRFNNEDLAAYIFPYIAASHYTKKLTDPRVKMVKNDPRWQAALAVSGETVAVDFGRRLQQELQELAIPATATGLDTYTEQESGRLYSNTYQKNEKADQKHRFGIGVYLNT